MDDVLQHLLTLYPYSPEKLSRIVFGSKNVAVMLTNGSIGVCSTLCNQVECTVNALENPDFSVYDHRILVNAWVNANVNYAYPCSGNADISDAINFSTFKQIAMIGYFGSLAEKLATKNIRIKAFDLDEEQKPVEPIKNLTSTLRTSDAVILTATSLSNNTFGSLIEKISPQAKVFILGPSTPLTPALLEIPNIAGLFGSQFNLFDYEVLSAIEQGGGTRSFLKRMRKVYMLK